LDATNAHAIIQTMKKLNEELGTTFLFSTHDEKVMQYLNRIIHLKGGEVEKDEIITAQNQKS
jgi:putative ABC transport system ATP-binding protein